MDRNLQGRPTGPRTARWECSRNMPGIRIHRNGGPCRSCPSDRNWPAKARACHICASPHVRTIHSGSASLGPMGTEVRRAGVWQRAASGEALARPDAQLDGRPYRMVDARQAEDLDLGTLARHRSSASGCIVPEDGSPSVRHRTCRAVEVRVPLVEQRLDHRVLSPSKPGTKWHVADRTKPECGCVWFGMICAPCGKTPMLSRRRRRVVGSDGQPFLAASARDLLHDQLAPGCSASGTPSAAAAHWRVVVGRFANAAHENSRTSPQAKACRRSAVMRCGSSPT